MTTERDCTEMRENVSTSATSEVAAQAWDSSNWRGNNPRADESKLTTIDMGDNDIYNSRRGNRELNDGNSGLKNAENKINRVVDSLLDGNYDTNKLVKELQKSDKTLDGAGDDYRGAIRHLGASSTTENLDDLVDGRRDVMDADKQVEKAIKQLKEGDENGAIKSLLQSLGKIDAAQKEFSDARTDEDERRSPRHGNLRDRGHGDDDCKDAGKKNTDDFRPGNRGLQGDNQGRMHDHMYRGGRNYEIPFEDPNAPLPYIADTSRSYEIPNPFGGTDRVEWGENGPSRITVRGPFGESATIDLDEVNKFGDKVAKVVDPIGIFPTPSELSNPQKLVKKVLDPLGLF